MENHHGGREIARPDAAQPANDAIHSAAILAYDARYSPKEAVAVLDDSRAVKQMFPGNEPKQDAAYRMMMHDQQMKGYPSVGYTDLSRFSVAETKEINSFVDTYKPSVNLTKVAKEESELARLGFPRIGHP